MEICLAVGSILFELRLCCLCPLLPARLLSSQLLHLVFKRLQLSLRTVKLILRRYASCWAH